METPKILLRKADEITEKLNEKYPRLAPFFKGCFLNTIETTVTKLDDGGYFVITGDIPAMWLRDSSVQIMQYLFFANRCESVRSLTKALLEQQYKYILLDPYANAFNREANGNGHVLDVDKQHPHVWERKFELDSLCYPLFLLCKYYEQTKDETCFTEQFFNAFDLIMQTFQIEQNHAKQSAYYHFNEDRPHRFIGHGTPVSNGGLVWSGYRPSDDVCSYGYYLPGNMFIVSVLTKLERIFTEVLKDELRAKACKELSSCVETELKKLSTVKLESGKTVYALETDGLGNYNLMDDANIPNLLSMPYYEYPYIDKEVYKNTRDFILSKENPYYFEGSALKGVGSPHTPNGYIWPLSIIIQAITSNDVGEINDCVNMLVGSTGGTGYMHESIYKDDDTKFTRAWFAWANSLFAWMILEKKNEIRGIEEFSF